MLHKCIPVLSFYPDDIVSSGRYRSWFIIRFSIFALHLKTSTLFSTIWSIEILFLSIFDVIMHPGWQQLVWHQVTDLDRTVYPEFCKKCSTILVSYNKKKYTASINIKIFPTAFRKRVCCTCKCTSIKKEVHEQKELLGSGGILGLDRLRHTSALRIVEIYMHKVITVREIHHVTLSEDVDGIINISI